MFYQNQLALIFILLFNDWDVFRDNLHLHKERFFTNLKEHLIYYRYYTLSIRTQKFVQKQTPATTCNVSLNSARVTNASVREAILNSRKNYYYPIIGSIKLHKKTARKKNSHERETRRSKRCRGSKSKSTPEFIRKAKVEEADNDTIAHKIKNGNIKSDYFINRKEIFHCHYIIHFDCHPFVNKVSSNSFHNQINNVIIIIVGVAATSNNNKQNDRTKTNKAISSDRWWAFPCTSY